MLSIVESTNKQINKENIRINMKRTKVYYFSNEHKFLTMEQYDKVH